MDRLAVQVALQRAERDCAAIGRPAGEEPAARRMHRVLAPRPDIDDEDPFGADSAWVAQVAAPRRAEDDRATVRREAGVEVESAAGARDASPAGAVCVHHPDVAVAGAIGNDASERRPLGGCDRPGPLDGGPRWAAGGRGDAVVGICPLGADGAVHAATTRITPRATRRSRFPAKPRLGSGLREVMTFYAPVDPMVSAMQSAIQLLSSRSDYPRR